MKSDDQKNETLTDKHEKKGRHGKGRLKIIPDLPRDGGSQKSHFKNVLWWLDQTLTFSFLSSDTGEGRTTSYWWWCSSTSEKIQGRERWRESVWKRYYWKILWSSVALSNHFTLCIRPTPYFLTPFENWDLRFIGRCRLPQV